MLTQLIAPKITLSPIKLEPLPAGYSFQVSGCQRSQELLFCVGSNSRTIPLSLSPAAPPTPMYSGLAPFTHKMLEFREVLAGQTVPCWVVPRSRSNPREIDWNNKSNQQMISIPVYGAPIWSGLPDPPCSSLGSDWMSPVFLSASKGRRIFYYANGTRGVFVTPENTLETSNSQRGYDIFSFWLATFGVAIKVSSGGVASGDHMAKLFNAGLPANGAPPVPTAWSILRDKITWSMLHRHIMWSADRVIFFYQPLSGPLSAHEWTPGGYKRSNLGAWPQEPAGSEKFTIRVVPPGFDFHVGPQSI